VQRPQPANGREGEVLENPSKGCGGWGARIAELVEFLAYGGMRVIPKPSG
jgi:hypothetical protein